MCAGADQARLRLYPAQYVEQAFPCGIVIQPRIEILVHPTRAFDGNKIVEEEACLLDLASDLVWAMEICRGELVRASRGILMNPVRQIALDNRRERCVAQRTLPDAITG